MKLFKLFFLVVLSALYLQGCKEEAGESETKKLKNNFYGNPSESGQWQTSESQKAYESMKDKELVFTFDDGPTGTTEKLLDYLRQENIKATFFVVGKLIKDEVGVSIPRMNIVKRANADGHIIGNHTYTHATSTNEWLKVPNKAEAFRDELLEADDILNAYISRDPKRFFRPPGGWWLAEETVYVIDHPRFKDYLGPVGWNIGGGPLNDSNVSDHECWASGLSAEECGDRYIARVERMRKGIVLFHDIDIKTYEMVKYIYPKLKAMGYRVIGLDQIPYYKNQ